MASSKFNRAQVGLQTGIGTASWLAATAMTINVPWRGTYEDKRQIHVAEEDTGTWTPTTRVALASTEVAATFEGTAFYEMMPVLLNSGFADVNPSVTYLHTYAVSPTAVGAPMPLTALFGTVGTVIAATEPAVRLTDLFLKTLTLSANINDKIVRVKGEFFGSTFDDNTAAGYAFDASPGTQPTMTEINGLRGVLRYQDVATTGDDFDTMTDFNCTMLDWELVIDTGIEPAWCMSNTTATTTWTALKYTRPVCTFKPIIRTTTATYAAVKAKADARTYQELQFYIPGANASTHYLRFDMTGRWDVVPTVHDDQDGEVVMKPTFLVETPYTQTSSAHWLTIANLSTHNWT
jgi:hypothetical protein